MPRNRRIRFSLGFIAFAMFFGGVALAVSNLGTLLHYSGIILSLTGAVMADQAMVRE